MRLHHAVRSMWGVIPDDSMFCPECGARQGGGAAGVPGQAPSPQANMGASAMGGQPVGGFHSKALPKAIRLKACPSKACPSKACPSKACPSEACPSRVWCSRVTARCRNRVALKACLNKACRPKACHSKDSNPNLEGPAPRFAPSAGRTCRKRRWVLPWPAASTVRGFPELTPSPQVARPSPTIPRLPNGCHGEQLG